MTTTIMISTRVKPLVERCIFIGGISLAYGYDKGAQERAVQKYRQPRSFPQGKSLSRSCKNTFYIINSVRLLPQIDRNKTALETRRNSLPVITKQKHISPLLCVILGSQPIVPAKRSAVGSHFTCAPGSGFATFLGTPASGGPTRNTALAASPPVVRH